MSAAKRTSILLLGITGDGKSTLGNVLLEKPFFKIGNNSDSCTNQTLSGTSTINGTEINIIDTPGFDDSEGNDKRNMDQMIDYLKKYEKGINLVIITKNACSLRFRTSDKILMQRIYQMFGTTKFFEHVCVVYTHFFKNQFSYTQKQSLLNMTEKIGNELKSISGYQYYGNIPSFFVESTEINNDPNSKQQI